MNMLVVGGETVTNASDFYEACVRNDVGSFTREGAAVVFEELAYDPDPYDWDWINEYVSELTLEEFLDCLTDEELLAAFARMFPSIKVADVDEATATFLRLLDGNSVGIGELTAHVHAVNRAIYAESIANGHVILFHD